MFLLLYVALDTLTLIFAISAAIFLGDSFRPNPIVFLLVFVLVRVLLYRIWFHNIQKRKTPWLRFGIHTTILTLLLPLLIGATAFLLPTTSNVTYWYIAVPAIGFLVSVGLHKVYKLA